jgi:hypothetical protein
MGRVLVTLASVAALTLPACGAGGPPSPAATRRPAEIPEVDGRYDAASPQPPLTSSLGSASDQSSRRERGDRASFYVAAADQASDGRSAVVEEVVLTGGAGWIAVHSSVAADLGPVIGHSVEKLSPGTHRNVATVITRPVVASLATVFVMVHLDTDGNDTFDYPAADGPAGLPEGGNVMVPVRLRVG